MYKNKRIIHLVCVGSNNEIGANNSLLWDIPEDIKFFRDTTLGNVCLVGRKTAESFPSPLKRRIVNVVTMQHVRKYGGVSTEQDVLLANLEYSITQSNLLNTNCIYVIGGQSVYKATEPYVDELLITQIDKEYPEADTFYNIPDGFEMVDKGAWNTSKDGEKYRFTKWQRLPF